MHCIEKLFARVREHFSQTYPCPDSFDDFTKSHWEKLCEDIEEVVSQNLDNASDDNAIKWDTLKRLWNENRFSKINTLDSRIIRTLNILSRYCGCASIVAFRNSHCTKKRIICPLFIGLILILVTTLLYFKCSGEQKPTPSEASIIEKVIREANEMQFKALLRVPNHEVYLDSLKQYYVEDGSAYIQLKSYLDGNEANGWILSNKTNPSHYFIHDIAVEKIEGSLAHARTLESWVLHFYDNHAHQYDIYYSSYDEQPYLLQKDSSGKWRVAENEYGGDKDIQVPRFVKCKTLLERINEVNTVRDEVNSLLSKRSHEVAVKLLECAITADSLQHKVQEISIMKKEAFRLYNTKKIKREEFNQKLKELASHIRLFMSQNDLE